MADTDKQVTPVKGAVWFEIATVIVLLVVSSLSFFSVGSTRLVESIIFSVIILALALITLLANPLKSQTPNSKTANITGLICVIAGIVASVIGVNFNHESENSGSDYSTVVHNLFATISGWAYTTAILLVVLLLVSFGFQMARRNRDNLIASISVMIGLGVSGISAAGWVLAPSLIHNLFQVGVLGRDFLHPFILIIVAVIFILALIGMVFASVYWLRTMREPLNIRETIGIVTIPVLMMGGLIPVLSAFAMWLISFS
jgi:hypothetical protein